MEQKLETKFAVYVRDVTEVGDIENGPRVYSMDFFVDGFDSETDALAFEQKLEADGEMRQTFIKPISIEEYRAELHALHEGGCCGGVGCYNCCGPSVEDFE